MPPPAPVAHHLGATAADLHLAPATSACAGPIQVQQRAVGGRSTLAHGAAVGARQQLDGLACDEHQGRLHRVIRDPAPLQGGIGLGCERWPARPLVELAEIVLPGLLLREGRSDHAVHGLAHAPCGLQITRARTPRDGEACSVQPAIEIGGFAQAFDRLPVAVAQGRDEVERSIPGDEAKRQLISMDCDVPLVDPAHRDRYCINW